jgi:hypothetical protein
MTDLLKLPDPTTPSNPADVVVHHHVHRHEPRPVAVACDEDAKRWLGLPHKPHTYKALGVPTTPLPGGKFAVLVADVEKALRDRAAVAPPPATEPDSVEEIATRAATAAGLRTGGRRG